MILNAENQTLGRLLSYAAKKALNGEEVIIVNAEKAVIVGNPAVTLKAFKHKRDRGDPYHGPFYPRAPDMVFRRVVRGMLPHKTARGIEAFKRLRVFISIPQEMKDKSFEETKGTANKGEFKSISLERLAKIA